LLFNIIPTNRLFIFLLLKYENYSNGIFMQKEVKTNICNIYFKILLNKKRNSQKKIKYLKDGCF
jgi:hypothetical protein